MTHDGVRDRNSPTVRARWLLLSAFLLLYLCLFRLPCTPIFIGEDQNLFLLDATRILDGQVMYKDFFELVAPGLVTFNAAVFKVFGERAWIPNAALVLLGLGLTAVMVMISRKVLSGASALLPAVLFLTCGFVWMLDDTHQWYSAIAELGAVAVVMERRTTARVATAGALCGLASFFTQTQGFFAVLGLVAFLVWERRKTAQHAGLTARLIAYLAIAYDVVVGVANGYFVWKAGLGRFLYCTVAFPAKYYSADAQANSLAVLVLDFPEMTQWWHALDLGVYLLLHLLPLLCALYWLRYWREVNSSGEQDTRLMLLSIMGLFFGIGIARTPSTYRLCAVAPVGLILLVALVHQYGRRLRSFLPLLWIGAVCFGIAFFIWTHTRNLRSLDLPRGRLAVAPGHYEPLSWLSQHTTPGEYFFTAAGTEFYFPLALRDAAEIPFVKTNDYTRPEQVQRTIAALASYRVHIVLSERSLGLQTGPQFPSTHAVPPRGPIRSFLHRLKALWVGENESTRDNLGPLREYLRAYYDVIRPFSNDTEVWVRRPE